MNLPCPIPSRGVCLLLKALLLSSFFTALTANAQITGVCDAANPCTGGRTLNPGVDAQLQLTWRGAALVGDRDVIVSEVGNLTVGDPLQGTSLMVVNASLTHPVMGSATGTPVSFTINESLSIPGWVSQQAVTMGARQLHYVRFLEVRGQAVPAVLSFNLAGIANPNPNPNPDRPPPVRPDSVSTAVNVSRVALRFDTGTLVETVAQGEPLMAVATISYRGSGMIEAVWEAAPLATSGERPIFRQLKNVRQFLGPAGQIVLHSPRLPANDLGIYSLRFRLIQPRQEQEVVILRYQVGGRSLTHALDVRELPVTGPSPSMRLGPATEFSWRAQLGARAYQLELYDRVPQRVGSRAVPVGRPFSGMQLTADQTGGPLSPSVLNYLEPNKTYYWRVVAIDAEGAIMAASALREIRTQ